MALACDMEFNNSRMCSPVVSSEKEFGSKVHDFNATEDGEACEESHCASYETKLCN